MSHTERNNHDQTPGMSVILQKAPIKRTKKLLLKNKHTEYIDIHLRKFILINSQSTMDLIYNEQMLKRINKSKKKMLFFFVTDRKKIKR